MALVLLSTLIVGTVLCDHMSLVTLPPSYGLSTRYQTPSYPQDSLSYGSFYPRPIPSNGCQGQIICQGPTQIGYGTPIEQGGSMQYPIDNQGGFNSGYTVQYAPQSRPIGYGSQERFSYPTGQFNPSYRHLPTSYSQGSYGFPYIPQQPQFPETYRGQNTGYIVPQQSQNEGYGSQEGQTLQKEVETVEAVEVGEKKEEKESHCSCLEGHIKLCIKCTCAKEEETPRRCLIKENEKKFIPCSSSSCIPPPPTPPPQRPECTPSSPLFPLCITSQTVIVPSPVLPQQSPMCLSSVCPPPSPLPSQYSSPPPSSSYEGSLPSPVY